MSETVTKFVIINIGQFAGQYLGFYVIYFLFQFLPASSFAQQSNYSASHFTNENGLPQNSIRGVEIDKEGYLWLATEFGLARYDGKSFRLYNQNNTAIKGDRIIQMGLLQDSSLFIEGEGDKFYILNDDGNLSAYRPDISTRNKARLAAGYRSNNLYDTCELRVRNGEASKWIVPEKPGNNFSLPNSLRYVYSNYFYFNKYFELVRADTALRHFNKIAIKGPLATDLKLSTTTLGNTTLLPDANRLYVRCGPWIYKLELNNTLDTCVSSRVLFIGDLPYIPFLRYYPAYDMYAIGTMTDGLYVFSKQLFSNLKFENSDLNSFYALVPYGTDGVFTKRGLLFPGGSELIPPKGINQESLLQTKAGHYFASRWTEKKESDIVELDEQLRLVRSIREPNIYVRCFLEFSDGKIWFSDDERFLGKILNSRLQFFPRPTGLPADFLITCFIETTNHTIWIAGPRGLAQIDSTGHLIRNVPELSGINVRTLYEDKEGTIWIGSYGQGFFAFYNNRLVKFPLDRNRYAVATHSFIEDGNGYLWFSTNLGLFQASVRELYDYMKRGNFIPYYYYYDQSNGLLSKEFNGGCNPSVIKLPNGKFSYPTLKSIVQFYPDSAKPLLPSNPIHIDAILMDTSRLQSSLTSLSINNSFKRLQFIVSSPFLGNEYNQLIEYRLTGLDTTWYRLNDDAVIQFKLPSGNYQLVLRKKAGFGVGNFVFEKRDIEVRPSFFETWKFKGLAVLLLLGLIFLVYKMRVRLLLKRQMHLEREIFSRTKEQNLLINSLENTISELESSKEQLYQNNLFKEKLTRVITHDLQSPLRFLFDATHRAYEKSNNKQYAELNDLNRMLYNSAGEIYQFVDEFAYWLNTMDEQFRLDKRIVNIPDLLTELEQFFQEQLRSKGNKLFIATNKNLDIISDRQLLKIILRNIIDNANKHTSNGIIEITTSVSNNVCQIRIIDTGSGIYPGLLARLKGLLTKQSIDYSEKEIGLGYRFIVDLSRTLKLNVNINSTMGTGTVVIISNFILDQRNSTEQIPS